MYEYRISIFNVIKSIAFSGGAGINVKSKQKKLQHIYRGLNKKLQANNKTI